MEVFNAQRPSVIFSQFSSNITLIVMDREHRGNGLKLLNVARKGNNDITITTARHRIECFRKNDLGFPQPGQWLEVFNSDVYENWLNPWTAGNQGSVFTGGPAKHNSPTFIGDNCHSGQ